MVSQSKQFVLLSTLSHYLTLTLSHQTKEFYERGGPAAVADIVRKYSLTEVPADGTVNVFSALVFFWEFIHRSELATPDHLLQFANKRNQLLLALAQTNIAITPAIHYLTNHLIEDYNTWGPLFFLLGEGSEAAHARDNRMKAPTLKGRESDHDAWNTWALLLRNLCALRSLIRSGIANRFVIGTAHTLLSTHSPPHSQTGCRQS